MSEENVEVVKRSVEAFNAGDMDTVRETLDPASSPAIWRVGRSLDLSRAGRR